MGKVFAKNIMRFTGKFLFIRYKMPTVLRMRLLLVIIKTVFPMFVRIAARFVEVQMPDKGC